ncbi:MAG: heavy metal translocating P-type ATPase metal-binding domain-containing protein [Bacteroidales bacterium]|nr:heavy metal translocating P-type ATPase metal-binding domain-containing protein [Bacteroidales bacterium]
MSEKIECIHCGEDCGKHPVVWEGKNFCCEGCKTVYQLLNENKLSNYYDLYESPGIKVEVQDFGQKYAYLDNEEIQGQLVYFKEGEYSKVKLYVPDIHCSSCIWLLENLYQLNKNITQSSVNFIKKEVDVTYKNTGISLREIVELMASIHYIPMINLEQVEGEKNKNENKKLIYKIGISGFVFGNTMLLSMPDYIPGGELLPENFKNFFGYLNLLFAIPVLFYCANGYLLSAYKNLKHKIVNIDLPISIGIITIFSQSAYVILSNTGTGYMDSLAGLVFFLLIGQWYQNKTYQALSFERDYKSYFPIAVAKLIDGKEEFIPLKNIQVGDQIVVHNQELIPADGVLMKGEANVNYSFVTGESKPVFKREGDELYAGGKQVGSTIVIEVVKEVMQSKLTQLWNQDFDSASKERDLSSIIDTISKYFTFLILAIAAAAATYWFFHDITKVAIAFTSVLIVACPCALALSIPFTYGNVMQIFGRIGFFLKKSQVVESLTHIDTVVFDKTGTITYLDSMSVKYNGKKLSDQDLLWAKSLTRQSKHPLSVAVYEYLDGEIIDFIDDYMEIASSGIKGKIEGKKILMGSADFVGKENFDMKANASMVHLSIDGVYYGYFSIVNKYRKGIENVASKLKKKFNIHIISGDNDAEKERLYELFGKDTELHFNQSPVDKLEYIKALKEKGHKVLMVGDGLNDAGALNESYVGISIADDVFNFSPASDAILEAKQFTRLPDLINYTHRAMHIVYASFTISFIYNILGLAFAVSGLLSPIIAAILMPISSVSVVAFVTLATRFALRKLKA